MRKLRQYERVLIRTDMDCVLCDSLKQQLAEAVRDQVTADDELRLGTIRADGSSEPVRQRLTEAEDRTSLLTHEFCKHRDAH
jgi:hypothetical protein